MICRECGAEIDESLVMGPVKCRCGIYYNFPYCKCIHREGFIGHASCACGSIFRCGLLNKLCGDKQPPDEWSDVGGVFLTPSNYQCSVVCPHFSVSPKTQ